MEAIGVGRRGISTPASLLIIFAGLFVAMSGLYTVAANTAEDVSEATEDEATQQRAVTTTGVEIVNASWNGSALTVTVNNTGETTLSVSETDFVVDGRYVSADQLDRRVDGAATDIWGPGEQLVVETSEPSSPTRVKFVTEHGVADTAEVSG